MFSGLTEMHVGMVDNNVVNNIVAYGARRLSRPFVYPARPVMNHPKGLASFQSSACYNAEAT